MDPSPEILVDWNKVLQSSCITTKKSKISSYITLELSQIISSRRFLPHSSPVGDAPSFYFHTLRILLVLDAIHIRTPENKMEFVRHQTSQGTCAVVGVI